MANVHGEGGSPLRLLEIAEAAGVSQATVSRVLNNKSGVAEATRQSVLTAVDVLGYSRPSNLQRAGTGAIGLVVPELDNLIFPALAQAVTTRLAAEGYTAVLCPTSAGGVQEDEYLSMLLERGVAGIVQVSGRHADTTASVARQREMLEAGLPLVLINGHREDLPAPSLSTDDGAAIHLAVEHLRRLGHDRIGLAVGPARYIPSIRKTQAFREIAAAQTFEVLVEHTWFTLEGGELATRRLVARGVSAIICGSDLMALGAIRAARLEGLDVPGDLSVVGYDGSMMCEHTAPPLTTVRQNVAALAAGAVDILVQQIKGQASEHDEVVFAPELVVRASTGPHTGAVRVHSST
ncbi:LacI family transcriptional regulator [Dermacoccus sp. PE3]|uniref:LacI family DNA-binding transcriptional regulator n=1 Tax=Dermacoccus sp. PE3 TaxID=1641401 RepID=UPI000641C336|nr:LacI family DNA-binding transcriptional regulator [Dermacoccus sp. PE3]KLO62138.1 LacI family transcriptional regulator [Dermacoccus sp. PE3]